MVSEEPIYADDPDSGVVLTFSEDSGIPDDPYMNFIYFQEFVEGTFVEDEFMVNVPPAKSRGLPGSTTVASLIERSLTQSPQA